MSERFMPRRAAVLGAGTMGAQIAAHLAGAGLDVLLLDIVPPGAGADKKDRDRLAREGLERARRAKPAAFFVKELSGRIEVGSLEDDLARCREADWVIEAVAERIEIKRELLARLEPHLSPNALLTTNTSGLSVAAMSAALSPDARRRFFGAHFFNPPRYLYLLELIPGPATDMALLDAFADFAALRLGKGALRVHDTPNFTANRIATFAVLQAFRVMEEKGLRPEQLDALTGPLLGRPKSATCRTADLVGLDILAAVARNVYEQAPGDSYRDLYQLPAFLQSMIERGYLGDKGGGGFYRKAEGGIESLDPRTLEYGPRQKPKWPALEMALNEPDLSKRLPPLLFGADPVGELLWVLLAPGLAYSALCVPEIAPDVLTVDRAMRWGFGWELGPFELWDLLGFERVRERLRESGWKLPEWVERLEGGFYVEAGAETRVFDPARGAHQPLQPRPGILFERGAPRTVRGNSGGSLVDLGEEVLGLVLHSKMNAIGPDFLAMLQEAIAEAESNWRGLVITAHGDNFSAGANIMLLLMAIQEGEWDDVELLSRQWQSLHLRLRAARVPVVAAPFGLCLGGGCELALYSHRVRAAAETYIGLPEAGVGLLPGAGGTTEMLRRAMLGLPDDADPLPFVKRVLETIGLAKVATSALEGRALGYLGPCDGITMDRQRRLFDARADVLRMAPDHVPMAPASIPVLGEDGLAALELGVHLMQRAGYASEHDKAVATAIAEVLCGGRGSRARQATVQELLDLERQNFLRLCGMRPTQERIAHTLKTGKPLRN
ncbi:MAG TPA: 3-hydroxyacyl-CoA dehydrogenase NAD-binding domain-containing protein [Acidobacteriota bacterium]